MLNLLAKSRYINRHAIAVSIHCSPYRLANRDTFGVKVFQTEDVHSIAVRGNALVVECINSTNIAKKMAGSQSVKLIFG